MNRLRLPRHSGTIAASVMYVSLISLITLMGCQPAPRTETDPVSHAERQGLQEWNPYAARLPLEPILYVKW